MEMVAQNAGDSVTTATKEKRDRRLHLSTVRTFLVSFAVLAFAFTFAFTTAWGAHMRLVESQSSTDVFKTLDLETLDGGHFTSENLKDAKVTLFNVWGTTCGPCLSEMPALEELNHSYAEGEIQIVGMLEDSMNSKGELLDSHIADAKRYYEKLGITFPTLILDEKTYSFMSNSIAGTPTTFFVDENGEIIMVVTGSNQLDNWKSLIDEALAKVS